MRYSDSCCGKTTFYNTNILKPWMNFFFDGPEWSSYETHQWGLAMSNYLLSKEWHVHYWPVNICQLLIFTLFYFIFLLTVHHPKALQEWVIQRGLLACYGRNVEALHLDLILRDGLHNLLAQKTSRNMQSKLCVCRHTILRDNLICQAPS